LVMTGLTMLVKEARLVRLLTVLVEMETLDA
jgi:hypothetical protein